MPVPARGSGGSPRTSPRLERVKGFSGHPMSAAAGPPAPRDERREQYLETKEGVFSQSGSLVSRGEFQHEVGGEE